MPDTGVGLGEGEGDGSLNQGGAGASQRGAGRGKVRGEDGRASGTQEEVTNGRMLIDNNAVERAIRPATLGRKNWLFAGSPRGARAAGIFLSLIDSGKRAGDGCRDGFLDVSDRIGDHLATRLEELLPNNWKPAAKAGEPGAQRDAVTRGRARGLA